MARQTLITRMKANTVADKLQEIQKHIAAQGTSHVYAILKSVGIQPRTFRNWIHDPKAAEDATLVKLGLLDRALDKLPRLDQIEYINNYRFSLQEMKEDEKSQSMIKRFSGKYDVFHRMADPNLSLRKIRIVVSDTPFFPIFLANVFTGGERRQADGFVFHQGDYIVMSGLSEYINSFFIFRTVVSVANDLLEGLITIQEKSENLSYTSSAVLRHSTNGCSDEDARRVLSNVFVSL
ncbi:hypothetical protein [Mesorhizobium sp. B2-3-5]|uniref:hypothetical protein n=1 Tax=Mesorhizobium sp. B2-3-5 TaxID=2589958 RepID=UPI00112919D5|nr:hypothetical protein [Mesorhizobium sp. B2-3-5]TPM21602.1 hypothetical protein FJ958_25810 [Mesorhizobium sp. B2-3-5]